jgi:hypothetical protein
MNQFDRMQEAHDSMEPPDIDLYEADEDDEPEHEDFIEVLKQWKKRNRPAAPANTTGQQARLGGCTAE